MAFTTRWTLPIAGVFFASICLADDEPEFRPLFDEARLVVGDEEFAPVEVIAPWRDFKQVGDQWFYVDGPRVVEVAEDYQTVINEVASTDGLDLAWLATWKFTAYFATRRLDAQYPDQHVWDVYPDPILHRLNLNNMTWRTPLEIQSVEPSDEADTEFGFDGTEYEPSRTFLGHVLITDDLVHVLTYEIEKPVADTWWGERLVSYQVTQFWHGEEQPVWARRFEAEGTFAIRSAPLHNRGWQAAISPLVAVEQRRFPGPLLLICAGNGEDLVAVENDTGQEIWRISRLWEYEPGYIPHDYIPYVSRFGVYPGIVDIAEGEFDKAANELTDEDWGALQKYLNYRSRFRREIEARIVAGPIVVPGEGIFVGVERRRRSTDDFGEHPAEGIVYEIAPDTGEPEAWVRLPSQLSDEIAPVADLDGSVWFCRDGSAARLLPRSDLYLPVDWFHSQPANTRPVGEFSGIPYDSHEGLFVRVGSPGYSRANDQTVEFINTRSGQGIATRLVADLNQPEYARAVKLDATTVTIAIACEDGVVGFKFGLSPILERLKPD